MEDSEFELISKFFTDSGLKYLYRDLESENGLQSIEAMKNALEMLNINNHDEITPELVDIYEIFIEYFIKVETIKYPDRNTYDRCVKHQNLLQRRFNRGRTNGDIFNSLFNRCKLVLPSLPLSPIGPLEISRYQFNGDNLKIFDMLYRIVRVNIGEIIKKSGEFANAYGDYIRLIYSNDEREIEEILKVLIEKGKSIVGPLMYELKSSFERLYRETNLSDEGDDGDLLSIPSVTSSDNSLASTLSLNSNLSDNGPLPETDVSDLEERLADLMNERTDTDNVSPEPVNVDDLQARLDDLMNNPSEPSADNEVEPRELNDDLQARLDSLRSGGSKRVRRKKTLRKKNVRKTAKRDSKKKSNKRTYKKRTYKKELIKNN